MYQCVDCLHPPILCQECIVTRHQQTPFHRLRRWVILNEIGAWESTSLAELGYILHTGHSGYRCPRALSDSVRVLQVVHINGQHSIPALFCQCSASYEDEGDQLLKLRLYPASDDRPQTAFTFQLLQHFLISQIEMCCAASSYYDMLVLQTDSVNTRSIKVSVCIHYRGTKANLRCAKNCYNQFLACTREWKVLQSFLRANSETGHDLRPGEAAVQCGFCPIPGVNIPDGWQEDPHAYVRRHSDALRLPRLMTSAHRDLLYRRFESFDGNFSLQLNDKGVSESVDPSIIGDAGYWVPLDDSHRYLAALAESNTKPNESSVSLYACGVCLCLRWAPRSAAFRRLLRDFCDLRRLRLRCRRGLQADRTSDRVLASGG